MFIYIQPTNKKMNPSMSRQSKEEGSEMAAQLNRNMRFTKEEKEAFLAQARSDLELYLFDSANSVLNMKLLKTTGNLGEAFTDPLRETGFRREQARRDTGLLALTDPGTFSDNREKALAKVGENITKSYYTAFQEYAEAGFSTVECKVKALSAAKIARAQGEEAVLARFGTLETKMADIGKVKEAQQKLSGFEMGAI